MKTLIALLAWCLLLVLCWPLAILALVLWPLVWLLSLPFRLIGITFTALFAFLAALLMLPARLLRGGPDPAARDSGNRGSAQAPGLRCTGQHAG